MKRGCICLYGIRYLPSLGVQGIIMKIAVDCFTLGGVYMGMDGCVFI